MPGRTEIYNNHNLSQDVSENPNNFHPDSRNIFFVLFSLVEIQLGVVLSNERNNSGDKKQQNTEFENKKTHKKNRVE